MTAKKQKDFIWSDYYKSHLDRPPNHTLVKGLEFFISNTKNLPRTAVDIGCGNGHDTVELLKNNFSVLAMDKEDEAINLLIGNINQKSSFLKTEVSSMETFVVPEVALINASYSLPFCNPLIFGSFMNMIKNNILDGGIFCGQLFGVDDDWSYRNDMNFHTKKEVKEIFKNFDLVLFEEVNEDSKTADGSSKHWHLFHVVASKKNV